MFNGKDDGRSHSILKPFFSGAVSGACSSLLLQPLDLVKTRIQRETVVPGCSRKGMLAVYRDIMHRENIFGLWRGLTPTLLRCVPGVGLYFSSLNIIQRRFGSETPGSIEILVTGAAARSFTGIALLPLTVTKVRLESGVYRYRGVMDALTSIYQREGAKGLYSGMLATLVRDAPFSSLYLLFYTKTKKIVSTELGDESTKLLVYLSSGIVAGTLASLVTQPADVIKTAMQMEKASITSSVRHIYKVKGVAGFLSGLLPRTIRRTAMAAVTWACYEYIITAVNL